MHVHSRYAILPALFVIAIAVGGCIPGSNANRTAADTAASANEPSSRPEPAPQADRSPTNLPAEFGRRLDGTIGDLPVRMSANRTADGFSGAYTYETKRASFATVVSTIYVTGTIDKAGRVQATETISTAEGEESTTGKLDGTLSATKDGQVFFEGTWSKPDGSKSLPFKLAESRPTVRGGRVTSTTWKEPDQRVAKVVSVKYPAFEGSADPVVVKLNAAILGMVTAETTEFRTFANEENPSAEDLERFALEIDYEVTYASDSIVSVAFYKYISYGGAHPSSDTLCLTFSLTDARTLTVSDLFKAGSNFRAVLNERGSAAMKGQDSTGVDLKDPSAFDRFYLTPRGIRFVIFVPHVMGDTAEIYIPYADLSAVINSTRGLS